MDALHHFRDLWVLDSEFHAPPGERPKPICLAARELRTGTRVQRWLWDEPESRQPFYTHEESLAVAYFASAEWGVYLACDWPIPERILDLYAEFRLLTAGRDAPCGHGLRGALGALGLPCLDALQKEDLRQLAIRGGPFTGDERQALLDYCQEDVDALARLLLAMLPHIDLPRALLRGRYTAAVARMERNGIPIDVDAYRSLRDEWQAVQGRLIADVDAEYGVYDGGHFSTAAFHRYLSAQGIPWPRLPSGALQLNEDAFADMAVIYPALKPLHDLRVALAQLKDWRLAVGTDGRNRVLLSPFGSKTGRNQPSTGKFIFGPAVWLRSLIRPEPGWGLAYVDYEQQEFGIGAALSGDPAMQAAYRSGDPYLTFGQQAGAIPPDSTKHTHAAERELYKLCALGVQYGMQAESLARRMRQGVAQARRLLELHRETYPVYWHWSNAVQDFAMLHGYLETVFGWRVHVGPGANPRSLRNFPLQANGAEMLRLACSLATEAGIRVCAPVHDALLVEAPLDDLDNVVRDTRQAMRQASELVLPQFPLRTEARLVCHPDRYSDPRGETFWELVWGLAQEQKFLPPVGGTAETVPPTGGSLFLPPVGNPPLLFSYGI
jgi:hypothetical protein